MNRASKTWFARCGGEGGVEWLTWECVSTALRHAPLLEFQKRIMRSAVPPPEASKFFCHGHHAAKDGGRRVSKQMARHPRP